MIKVVRSFDMAAYKFGSCEGLYPARTVSQPVRYEEPERIGSHALSPDERAWATLTNALRIIKKSRPDVVILEDCTIQFITKDKDGRPVFKSKGKQDYHVKRNIGSIEFYCRMIAKPRIEVELVNIGRMKAVCAGTGRADKKALQDAMIEKYDVLCPTDDHSDAVGLLDYYFLTH